jgi:hypothetical protein
MLDSPILRIKRVNSQTDAFKQDIRIRGLRSTIISMVQKVKFWSTLEPLSNQLKCIFLGCYILPHNKEFVLEFTHTSVTDKMKDRWNIYHIELASLKNIRVLVVHS